tara:strand:+ start:521 stop:700 length:180 start_codon:yes stop_codon:yes gene_type:complete
MSNDMESSIGFSKVLSGARIWGGKMVRCLECTETVKHPKGKSWVSQICGKCFSKKTKVA